MSKRARGEDPIADAQPSPKRAKSEESAERAGECSVFTLVSDVFGKIAPHLDPFSQRAFCCASREAAALMGSHRREFDLPMLKWVAAPPDENTRLGKETVRHRKDLAERRQYLGLHYDHAAYCYFQMPFFDSQNSGMRVSSTSWVHKVLASDAVECLRYFYDHYAQLPDARATFKDLIQRACWQRLCGPKITDYAIRNGLLPLFTILGQYESSQLRIGFSTAPESEIKQLTAQLESTNGSTFPINTCRRFLLPVFRCFSRGNTTALYAILDAMEQDDEEEKRKKTL